MSQTDGSSNRGRRLELTFTGRVQGVGMRAFLQQNAQHLRLEGYAQNRTDGSVYVVAEGAGQRLETFLDTAARGPRAAHVNQVKSRWGTATREFTGFHIR